MVTKGVVVSQRSLNACTHDNVVTRVGLPPDIWRKFREMGVWTVMDSVQVAVPPKRGARVSQCVV